MPNSKKKITFKYKTLITLTIFSVVSLLIIGCLLKLYFLPIQKLHQSYILKKPSLIITLLSLQILLSFLWLSYMHRKQFGWSLIIGVIVHITLSIFFLWWVIYCNKKPSKRENKEWCAQNESSFLLPLLITNICFVFFIILVYQIPLIFQLYTIHKIPILSRKTNKIKK